MINDAVKQFRAEQAERSGIDILQRTLNRVLPNPGFTFPVDETLTGLASSNLLPEKWRALFTNHPKLGRPAKLVECIILCKGFAEMHRDNPDLEKALAKERKALVKAAELLTKYVEAETWADALGGNSLAQRLETDLSLAMASLKFLGRYISATLAVHGPFYELALPKTQGRENVALNCAVLLCEQLKGAIGLPQYEFVQAVSSAIFTRRRIPSSEDIRKAFNASEKLSRPQISEQAVRQAEDFMRNARAKSSGGR